LASSDDEYDVPFNRKEFKASNTMQTFEEIIERRAADATISPKTTKI
jgi:hypothetical protein